MLPLSKLEWRDYGKALHTLYLNNIAVARVKLSGLTSSTCSVTMLLPALAGHAFKPTDVFSVETTKRDVASYVQYWVSRAGLVAAPDIEGAADAA